MLTNLIAVGLIGDGPPYMVLDMLEQQDMLEIQLSSLRARLAAIPEGKEHKRERVVLSKKIYACARAKPGGNN